MNEDCYPYESGTNGFAPGCKINTIQNRMFCPTNNKIYNKHLLTSGASYPIKAESAVFKKNLIYKKIVEKLNSNFIHK